MNIVNKYLVPNGYAAITIYPFVFYKKKEYITAHRKVHEGIHLKQQAEMLVIPFYIWYFIEYLIGLFKGKTKSQAYRNISFEKEAYDNEWKLDYLLKRERYSWFKYLNR